MADEQTPGRYDAPPVTTPADRLRQYGQLINIGSKRDQKTSEGRAALQQDIQAAHDSLLNILRAAGVEIVPVLIEAEQTVSESEAMRLLTAPDRHAHLDQAAEARMQAAFKEMWENSGLLAEGEQFDTTLTTVQTEPSRSADNPSAVRARIADHTLARLLPVIDHPNEYAVINATLTAKNPTTIGIHTAVQPDSASFAIVRKPALPGAAPTQ